MQAALPDPNLRFQGLLYRALNPLYARDPLSGVGAALHGGRLNAKGQPALYTALTAIGAVVEANQIGRPFEPVTLVSYQADVMPIFNATDPANLAKRSMGGWMFAADDWRIQMANSGRSGGQILAVDLARSGYAGIIVPSFARGAAADARNLVLWDWRGLSVIDSDNRLK